MTKGVEIDVAMNVRKFQAGAKDVEAGFEQVSDALDDLAQDGDTAGDKIAAGLTEGGKKSETAVDRLADRFRDVSKASDRAGDDIRDDNRRSEKSFKDLADTAKRESKSGFDSMAQASRDSTEHVNENVQEVKDEFKSNLSEVVSSFDGSMNSVADLVQGTLGGLAGSIGGLPAMFAVIAGALTIGTVVGQLEAGTEKSEAMKEKVAELTAELLEAGDEGGPSIEYLVDQLKSLATETDDSLVSLDKLRKTADTAGSSYEDLAQAYAGNADALDELNRKGAERLRALEDEAEATDTTTNAGVERYSALEKQIAAQDQYNQYLSEAAARAKDAAQQEQNYGDAGGKAMETRAAAVDAYQGELDSAVSSYADFTNAETGALDPGAYLAGIQARIDATANFNSNVQDIATRFKLTDDEVQAILDQGVDFAPMLQSIKDAGLESQFVATLQSAVGGGQEILDNSGLSATAEVDADTDKAESATDAFTSEKRDTTVQVNADPRPAQQSIAAVTGGSYNATVRVGADLSDAEAEVAAFMRRNRTITITANVVDRAGREVL